MTKLTDAAAEALAAREAAEEAARKAERDALRQAALDAVTEFLARGDGTPLTIEEAGLLVVDTDMGNRLVVVSDGAVYLSVSDPNEDGNWGVRLVQIVDGRWANPSDRLRSLADLGAALAAVS